MATLRINLENGFFSSTHGRYVTEVTPTHVVGNGWDCVIREDGSVLCEARRQYFDGYHSMRYEIANNGFAKLTLQVGKGAVKTLWRGFVLPRGAKLTDGAIGLAGGYVDDRYAYFRDGPFQRFLDKFGITAVKHEDPNRTFVVRNARYGGGECRSGLVSDGVVTKTGYDSGRTDVWHQSFPGTCAYEGEASYAITEATWAIYTQDRHEGDSHNYARILYTQAQDVAGLEGSFMSNAALARYVLKKEQATQLENLEGARVTSVDDIQKVMARITQIAPRINSIMTEGKAEAFLRSFDLEDGEFFFVSVCGPMTKNAFAEYEISIRCGNGNSYYGRQLNIAEGFLG